MMLVERLRAALEAGHRRELTLFESDHRDAAFAEAEPLVPAAVLIAVTDRPEPGVILIQRTDTMRRHAGQIAFPGGRIDPEDDGPVGAALREAEEEIGLPQDRVTVIGETDSYRTVTGYRVTPVVGVVPPDLPLAPHEAEVAGWFEAPLAFLLAPENQVERTAIWQDRERRYHEILWQDRRIWGATAAMIVNLGRRLQWTA